MCGSDLKSRFGVNGIQYSSSEMRFDAACSWIVSSAWPIVFSFVGAAGPARTHRAAYARINLESYTLCAGLRHAALGCG
jgi:hypothetical protein